MQRALEATADQLYHESEDKTEVSAGQRRADALGLVAESALAGDLDRGAAGDRYQVVVHVDADVLQDDAGKGQSALEDEDGIHVPAATSRRIACDASRVVMRHGPDGTVLDVGRKTRTIPPAISRALAARGQTCRFPGCSCRHCDAHHVRHWAAGGATRLDNLLLLCRRHHRAVHEEGFTVELRDDGEARFVRPDGQPFPEAPPAPRWAGAALEPTTSHLAAAGITIDGDTATPIGTGNASTRSGPLTCSARLDRACHAGATFQRNAFEDATRAGARRRVFLRKPDQVALDRLANATWVRRPATARSESDGLGPTQRVDVSDSTNTAHHTGSKTVCRRVRALDAAREGLRWSNSQPAFGRRCIQRLGTLGALPCLYKGP